MVLHSHVAVMARWLQAGAYHCGLTQPQPTSLKGHFPVYTCILWCHSKTGALTSMDMQCSPQHTFIK